MSNLVISKTPEQTRLNSTTATALHEIADVSWLNACADE